MAKESSELLMTHPCCNVALQLIMLTSHRMSFTNGDTCSDDNGTIYKREATIYFTCSVLLFVLAVLVVLFMLFVCFASINDLLSTECTYWKYSSLFQLTMYADDNLWMWL